MNIQDLVGKYKTNQTTQPTVNNGTPKTVQDLVAKYKNYKAPTTDGTLGEFIGQKPQPLLKKIITNTADDYDNAPSMTSFFGSGQSKNPVINAAEGIGNMASSGASTILAPISEAVRSISNDFAEKSKDPLNKNQPLYNNPIVSKVLDFFGNASGQLDKWSQAHPEAAQNLGNLLNVGMTALGAGEEVPTPSDISKGIIDTADEVKTGIKNKTIGVPKTDVEIIQEKIAPKPTLKEARTAQAEGRLVKGKDPTLFKSGTEDKVIPSKSNIKSSETILKNVPNATKMTQPELYTALKEKVTDISQNLKPEMQKVPIKTATIEKINSDWKTLKKTEIEEARATEEPNVKKGQLQFEKILQKSGNETMDDLWDTAKSYDNSVPDNVKDAGPLSSRDLQDEKSIWLQRRAIIRDAINDAKSGMGKTSQDAFSDMHDMYNAQQNLQSTAKIDTTIKPSRLSQFGNSNTGKLIKLGVTGGGAAEAIKKFFTGNF